MIQIKNVVINNNRVCWCTLFPYLPEVMYEGCGYKFIKIEDLLERNTKPS